MFCRMIVCLFKIISLCKFGECNKEVTKLINLALFIKSMVKNTLPQKLITLEEQEGVCNQDKYWTEQLGLRRGFLCEPF